MGKTIVTRLERCQRWLARLMEAARSDKNMTAARKESFRVGVINVERKLREVVVEVVGTSDDVGESE